MSETTPQDQKLDFSTKRAANRVERMLDDAVEDSFPASDPVALSMPHDRVESKLPQLGTASVSTILLLSGLLAVIALIALRK
jgi:hypothetical protein